MAFYGVEVSVFDIEQKLIREPTGGTFLTELATYTAHLGFSAEVHAYNLYFTDPEDAQVSSTELKHRVRSRHQQGSDPEFELICDSITGAIDAGVIYKIVRPSIDAIKVRLQSSIPIIVSVSPAALYKHSGDPFAGHDIVLCGLDGDSILFLDPETGREQMVSADDLLFSMLARKITAASAYMLVIGPTK